MSASCLCAVKPELGSMATAWQQNPFRSNLAGQQTTNLPGLTHAKSCLYRVQRHAEASASVSNDIPTCRELALRSSASLCCLRKGPQYLPWQRLS